MLAVTITETAGHVRLDLGGLARGEGASLQEAADALVRRTVELALAFRASGFSFARELHPDLESMNLLHEIADIAARGGDIRVRVFE
jgi:hypothetical protein